MISSWYKIERDKSLTDLAITNRDELAEDIVEDLESALDSFRNIIVQLKQPDEANEWLLNELKSICLATGAYS